MHPSLAAAAATLLGTLAPVCPARGRGGGPAIFVRSKFSGAVYACSLGFTHMKYTMDFLVTLETPRELELIQIWHMRTWPQGQAYIADTAHKVTRLRWIKEHFRRQPLAFLRFADGGASGGDALGKQVPAGEAALTSRPCTSLSLGHSARVRAGSSATSTTP